MRSSAEPQVLLFDIEKKHCAIVLHGRAVDAARVIYVPRHHYPDGFDILATSSEFYWEGQRQLLQWRPDATKTENLIIICPPKRSTKRP
jgi:hypothetical protein